MSSVGWVMVDGRWRAPSMAADHEGRRALLRYDNLPTDILGLLRLRQVRRYRPCPYPSLPPPKRPSWRLQLRRTRSWKCSRHVVRLAWPLV